MAISVEINKNIVLLFALLNRFELAAGDIDTTDLRKEMFEHFKGYSGEKPNEKDYIHYSKGVFWSLAVSEAPEFKQKDVELNEKQQREFDFGKQLKPFLLDFYKNTDFENYYTQVLSKLEEIAEDFRKEFGSGKCEKLLEEAWGIPVTNQMVIIPNPFTQSSNGPTIGDINYQVLGMWKGRDIKSYSHNIIHEGSHPLAKQLLKPYLEDIESLESVLKKAHEDENYPKSYRNTGICFEEHLIRAVQRGFINPKNNSKDSAEKGLEFEKENNGMVFIYDFYEELKNADSVEGAVPKIINHLKTL